MVENWDKVEFVKCFPGSDVCFIVDDGKIYAQKAMLASHSPVFNSMLYGDFKESKMGEICLPGKLVADLNEFFEHMKPSKCGVLDENLSLSVLELSDEFQVVHLRKRCLDLFLRNNSFVPAPHWCLKALITGLKISNSELVDKFFPIVKCSTELSELVKMKQLLPQNVYIEVMEEKLRNCSWSDWASFKSEISEKTSDILLHRSDVFYDLPDSQVTLEILESATENRLTRLASRCTAHIVQNWKIKWDLHIPTLVTAVKLNSTVLTSEFLPLIQRKSVQEITVLKQHLPPHLFYDVLEGKSQSCSLSEVKLLQAEMPNDRYIECLHSRIASGEDRANALRNSLSNKRAADDLNLARKRAKMDEFLGNFGKVIARCSSLRDERHLNRFSNAQISEVENMLNELVDLFDEVKNFTRSP